MMSPSITMITYSYTIAKICNLVHELTYICFEHMRLMIEDTRNPRTRHGARGEQTWLRPLHSSVIFLLFCMAIMKYIMDHVEIYHE